MEEICETKSGENIGKVNYSDPRSYEIRNQIPLQIIPMPSGFILKSEITQ